MNPFVEKVLLLHKLGRRISEAGDPSQPPRAPESIDDLAVQELLDRADRIAALIVKREHLHAEDEKAILAAAFLTLRRRTEKTSGAPPATLKSYFLFA
jgi:isopropylmalate/homocitrate/citramalate synthase